MLRAGGPMVVPKYSIFLVMVMCSCVHSEAITGVNIDNQIKGCANFNNKGIQRGEPVILNLEVKDRDVTQACPCKSALFQYTASQISGKDVSTLITGSFTALNKKSVALPLSVQSQLVYKELPINLHITCANQ